MSERECKWGWLRNWRAARDKMRESLQRNDTEQAFLWADVAQKIEEVFESFFGQNFGEYLASVI